MTFTFSLGELATIIVLIAFMVKDHLELLHLKKRVDKIEKKVGIA